MSTLYTSGLNFKIIHKWLGKLQNVNVKCLISTKQHMTSKSLPTIKIKTYNVGNPGTGLG